MRAVLSLIQFLSALTTLMPLADGCFVQSILPQLRRVLTIRLPRISATASGALRAVFDPNSAAQLKKETVEEILLVRYSTSMGLLQTVANSLWLSSKPSTLVSRVFKIKTARTVSLETLSYILPCLLMKQVRSTTGRDSERPPAVFRCFPSLKKSGNVRSSIWCLCSLCWLYERLRKNGTLKED